MAQSWNDDPHDRDLDIGTGLIENEEIESITLGKIDARHHLLALVETAKGQVAFRSNERVSIRRLVGMVAQVKRRSTVVARRGATRSHQTDRKKLVYLGQRP